MQAKKPDQNTNLDLLYTELEAAGERQKPVIDRNVRDTQRWSNFSLIAATLGILTFLGGAAVVVFGGAIAVGSITGIGGAIITITTQLFLKPTEKKTQESLRLSKEFEYIRLAIKTAHTLSPGPEQNRCIEKIIDRLLDIQSETQKTSDQRPSRRSGRKVKELPKQTSSQ